VKLRPRDRVNDRRPPFELGELQLSLLTHVFANVKPALVSASLFTYSHLNLNMELQIPTVTIVRVLRPAHDNLLIVAQDDLRAFHAQHFPHAPAPEYILHGTEPATEATEEYYEEYYEEDDGLGYYPDGTKRTLTDEQIAMFRHSEIHATLRKRQLRKENGELSEGELDPASPAPNAASPASTDSMLRTEADADKTQAGQVEGLKKQQWATNSAKSKAKNKRKRNNYAARRKTLRTERGLPRRRSGRDNADSRDGDGDGDDDDESDEWDPWHQANGPDVQKDETLDLDY
jgi:hypothetical protein